MIWMGAIARRNSAGDPTPITPVHLGSTLNGATVNGLTYDAANPAYSVGDLVLLCPCFDRQISQLGTITVGYATAGDPTTGPDGETIVQVQAPIDNGVGGTSANGMGLYYFIATAAKSAGAGTMRVKTTSNSDLLAMPISVWDAGTFNPTTPLQFIDDAISATAVANLTSAAGTVTLPGGKLIVFAYSDVDRLIPASVPAGWTYPVTPVDLTNHAVAIAIRTAVTGAGEALTPVDFPLAANNPWISLTAVVNPAYA